MWVAYINNAKIAETGALFFKLRIHLIWLRQQGEVCEGEGDTFYSPILVKIIAMMVMCVSASASVMVVNDKG